MLSVIIPTLDEAAALPRTLDAIARHAADGEKTVEVIVVDANSRDATVAVARAKGCIVVRSSRAQRAAQMNAGAARAHGEVLVFLHADTVLPPDAPGQVLAACAQPDVVGGGFARRYDSPSRWLRLTCWLARWRNRWFGWHLGDQAIFVRRSVFERIGGFSDLDVFEDLDFSRRLAGEGRLVTLEPPVWSSARRFAGQGAFRRSLTDAWLMWRYLLGAAPQRLGEARVRLPSPSLSVIPAVQTLGRDAHHVEQQEQRVG